MNLILFAVSDVAETILYILLALVVLLVMITIHEAGHYTAGKILGFKINEFAIGMGPKLFSRKKKNGEVFSIRLFPLGGYCAFDGEDENLPDSPDAFNNQKPWKRIIVLVSGALFNFISAVLIVFIAFWAFGDDALAIKKVYDTSVNYDAYQAGTGFKEGDIIYKIDGKTVYLVVDVSNYIANAGEEMDVVVLRENEQGKRVKVTIENVKKGKFSVDKLDENGNVVLDENGNPVKEEATGWGVQNAYVKNNFSFGQALGRSVPYCLRAGGYILETLGGLVTGRVPIKDIGGPITTIDMTTQVIRTGFSNVLFLITLISVNLAVFNLLPLPALDGSRVVFVLIEWIFRKPVNRKVEGWIHAIGMISLFGLVILVDILRYLT